MNGIWSVLVSIFKQSSTSIQGYINVDELMKALRLAIGSGGTIWTILAALQASAGTIITDPTTLSEFNSIMSMLSNKNYIGLAFFAATLAFDLYRRSQQGIDITPSIPVIKQTNDTKEKNPQITL